MSKQLQVIAVEVPFFVSIPLLPKPVQICYFDNNVDINSKDGPDIYIYTSYGESIPRGKYHPYIKTISYAINEGKYEWADFLFEKGQTITRDYNFKIYKDGNIVNLFTKPLSQGEGKISNLTIKFFNEFLKTTNKNQGEMVDALKSSFEDGLFENEIIKIIQDDKITEPSNFDREIIVRCKIEGYDYIIKRVRELLSNSKPDTNINLNYFFRRLFNLEKFQYISFENI